MTLPIAPVHECPHLFSLPVTPLLPPLFCLFDLFTALAHSLTSKKTITASNSKRNFNVYLEPIGFERK